MDAVAERERTLQRAANLRAGLIGAILVNIHRKPGTAATKPGDFFREPDQKMTVKEAQEFMLALARRR